VISRSRSSRPRRTSVPSSSSGFDQLQDAARVIDRRRAQLHHLVGGDHRAGSVVGKQLDQQGTRHLAADDVGALYSAAHCLDRMGEVEPRVLGEPVAACEQIGGLESGRSGSSSPSLSSTVASERKTSFSACSAQRVATATSSIREI